MIKLGALTKNSIYNLLGAGLPMVVGLFTIPRLIHVLGMERFGVLTLTWVVLGYFSLFDLGLGRALTQVVAERSGVGDQEELPDIIRTALIMMLLLGLFGGLCLAGLAPLLVGKVLKMSPGLQTEALQAFELMAVSLPAVTLLSGVRGILEGRQRFFGINILRLGMGVLTFLGPWLISYKTVNLVWVVMSLVVMRYGALLGHYWLAQRSIPEMSRASRFQSKHWKYLIKFGGWMTISGIISPLMVNMDRLFMGAYLSLGVIAYYATPFEMVTKLLMVPGAVVAALFPMFGALHRVDPKEVRRLYNKGIKSILMILAPTLLILAVGAHMLLSRWINADFAEHGTAVMQILCLGVFINSLAYVPYSFIQGVARPDLTAKFHMIEIPFYLIILWLFGSRFGVVGVAWAWTIRVILDYILLSMAARTLQSSMAFHTPATPIGTQ